jgi:hypothetical protein
MTILNKKIPTAAEIQWRKERQDERWEIRADYLQLKFSRVTTLLPRQITYLNELALCKAT